MKQIWIIMTLVSIASQNLAQHQNTNTHFLHTVQTTASSERIWAIWTTVSEWHRWDTGLKSATLENQPFKVGTKGILISQKGAKTKFIITQVEHEKSYTFKTKIPLGWLVISRTLQKEKETLLFTHEVRFTGILKGLFGKILGSKFRVMLPEVMETIKNMAEKENLKSVFE